MGTIKLDFPTPLTEKHRPKTVKGFIGLQKVKRIMEGFIARPYPSAWLFLGPPGIGKTTMGLAIADQINAELHHVPSQNCNVDTVQEVTRQCHSAAFNFRTGQPCSWHVVLVDEGDRMTPAAQVSFLSLLDSTAMPPQTIFIFTCNSKTSLEDRFLSRCRVLNFGNDTLDGELEEYLKRIYRKEGGKYPIAFVDLCKSCSYNVRDSLQKLELELMLGADRSDLPEERGLVVEEHTHNCRKCHKIWKHSDPKCELPFRSDCPQCGGAQTVGQHRAKKAWDTIRKNIAAEVKEDLKKKRVSGGRQPA